MLRFLLFWLGEMPAGTEGTGLLLELFSNFQTWNINTTNTGKPQCRPLRHMSMASKHRPQADMPTMPPTTTTPP